MLNFLVNFGPEGDNDRVAGPEHRTEANLECRETSQGSACHNQSQTKHDLKGCDTTGDPRGPFLSAMCYEKHTSVTPKGASQSFPTTSFLECHHVQVNVNMHNVGPDLSQTQLATPDL